jgi:hypothetical protein
MLIRKEVKALVKEDKGIDAKCDNFYSEGCCAFALWREIVPSVMSECKAAGVKSRAS